MHAIKECVDSAVKLSCILNTCIRRRWKTNFSLQFFPQGKRPPFLSTLSRRCVGYTAGLYIVEKSKYKYILLWQAECSYIPQSNMITESAIPGYTHNKPLYLNFL